MYEPRLNLILDGLVCNSRDVQTEAVYWVKEIIRGMRKFISHILFV